MNADVYFYPFTTSARCLPQAAASMAGHLDATLLRRARPPANRSCGDEKDRSIGSNIVTALLRELNPPGGD